MKALVTPASGAPFHLWWDGMVVADSDTDPARRAVALLNDELDMPTSRANPGGTDSHWIECGRLQTEDDFLLTVGSIVDRLDGILTVDLIGKSGAVHQGLLDKTEAENECPGGRSNAR